LTKANKILYNVTEYMLCVTYGQDIEVTNMPTIQDVAKRAGVSTMTVSRVINDSGYVSQKTRENVEIAIDELGYVPNMLGPSLRFSQTMAVAMVLTDITNPFWTTVARGVEDVAHENGYSTILCNTDESEEKQEQYIHMLLRRRVDGIIFVPASNKPSALRLIQKQGMPLVLLDRQIPGEQVDLVQADSEGGAYQLTRHLLDLGHRQIKMLSGPKIVSTAVDRVNGFSRAMREAGLTGIGNLINWGAFTQESGYAMIRETLKEKPLPSAIFAANNFIAIGALQALREEGLNIPGDIALVTIDDIPPTFTLTPFLTVVAQPAREMGEVAMEILLRRIKGERDGIEHVVLPTKMIIRSSSGSKVIG
jgi:LacI family transcriptional regulator